MASQLFEVTNRLEQSAIRTVGTVSGANVIGTLCDIVTVEHATIALSSVPASISEPVRGKLAHLSFSVSRRTHSALEASLYPNVSFSRFALTPSPLSV